MEQTPSPMYITPSPSEPTTKRSRPSARSGGSYSAGSDESTASYWEDWENYASGGESHDNKQYKTRHNHDIDSHITVNNTNSVSSTERRSAAAEEAENGDSHVKSRDSHVRSRDDSHVVPRQAVSLSASINSIADSFPRQPTPEGYVEIMAALKILGEGVENLRAELRVVGGIEHKVRAMETQISNLESELGVVHDKIDDICQATVLDSSCSSSSAHYVERSYKSKL